MKGNEKKDIKRREDRRRENAYRPIPSTTIGSHGCCYRIQLAIPSCCRRSLYPLRLSPTETQLAEKARRGMGGESKTERVGWGRRWGERRDEKIERGKYIQQVDRRCGYRKDDGSLPKHSRVAVHSSWEGYVYESDLRKKNKISWYIEKECARRKHTVREMPHGPRWGYEDTYVITHASRTVDCWRCWETFGWMGVQGIIS